MVVDSKEVKLAFKDKDGVRLAGSSITVEELASCAKLLKEAGVVSVRSIRDNPPTWY